MYHKDLCYLQAGRDSECVMCDLQSTLNSISKHNCKYLNHVNVSLEWFRAGTTFLSASSLHKE